MKRLVALTLLCLSGSAFSQTVTEPETPDTWVVRTFQFPPDFLMLSGTDVFSKEIDINTPSDEVVELIKKTSAQDSKGLPHKGEALKAKGIPPPPKGSAALIDSKSGTFVVRTTAEQMELVEAFADTCGDRVPVNILHTLHLIEADGATLRQVAHEATTLFYHNEIWKRLEGLAKQGKVKHLNTLRLEARSNQKARVESAPQIKAMTDFTLGANGRVSWDTPLLTAGNSFEIESVIGPDGQTVSRDIAFEYHFAPTTTRNERITHSLTSPSLMIPVTDLYRVRANTATMTESGNIKLISLWKPNGGAEFENKDVLQAAFMETEVVKLLPPLNKDLEKIFLAHVDQAVPLPKEPPAKSKLPPGMKTKTYVVPADLLSLAGPSADTPTAPADPFAAAAPAADPFESHRGPTAQELLQGQGIGFPQGASAIFHRSAKRLTVTNTAPNLDQVDAFIDSIRICQTTHGIALTLHLIQADGATLRQIASDHATTSDQAEVLLALEKLIAEGKAKSLQVLRLETRSGQRTTTEAGLQWMMLENVKSDDQGSQSFHHQLRSAGTRFEVDPVMGPDGFTIDLDFDLEHHFALPAIRNNEAEKVPSIGSPAIDFHFAKVTTSVTMHSGMTKLIGLWKPEGAPEFEGKDLMQAAFLTATIVQPMTDKKP